METCPRDHATPLRELGLARQSAWQALEDLIWPSAHKPGRDVAIPKHTRMVCEQSLAAANIWFPTVLFRFRVIDGPDAGECVWLETDERAIFPDYGLSPVL
jgi:hypothetical protein